MDLKLCVVVLLFSIVHGYSTYPRRYARESEWGTCPRVGIVYVPFGSGDGSCLRPWQIMLRPDASELESCWKAVSRSKADLLYQGSSLAQSENSKSRGSLEFNVTHWHCEGQVPHSLSRAYLLGYVLYPWTIEKSRVLDNSHHRFQKVRIQFRLFFSWI
jgi:hypothetical protein